MVVSQKSNVLGIQAVDNERAAIATVSADGGVADNTFDIPANDVGQIPVGSAIDVYTTGGTAQLTNRTVTTLTSAGAVTFGGAVAGPLTVGAEVFITGQRDKDAPTNYHGGPSVDRPYHNSDMNSVAAMRARLTQIDANAYSNANLNLMSYNDLIYALRVHDDPGTLK